MKFLEQISKLAIGTYFILNGKKYQRKNTPVGNGCTTSLHYLGVDFDGKASIIEKVTPVAVCN